MALRKHLERGKTGRRLDPRDRAVLPQRPHELVDLVERVAGHLLDRLERLAGALQILLLEESRRAGLDEDHVDRVAGGVVEVAGDAGALLGRRQAALALGLALRAQRPLLELREALAPQP